MLALGTYIFRATLEMSQKKRQNLLCSWAGRETEGLGSSLLLQVIVVVVMHEVLEVGGA
jgi:hypothetical protein